MSRAALARLRDDPRRGNAAQRARRDADARGALRRARIITRTSASSTRCSPRAPASVPPNAPSSATGRSAGANAEAYRTSNAVVLQRVAVLRVGPAGGSVESSMSSSGASSPRPNKSNGSSTGARRFWGSGVRAAARASRPVRPGCERAGGAACCGLLVLVRPLGRRRECCRRRDRARRRRTAFRPWSSRCRRSISRRRWRASSAFGASVVVVGIGCDRRAGAGVGCRVGCGGAAGAGFGAGGAFDGA